MQAIFKYTYKSHPDYENLRKALTKMQAFAVAINNRKAAKATVIDIAKNLHGYPDNDLVKESRYYVREGWLWDDKKKLRYCFLFNDLLLSTRLSSKSREKLTDISKSPRNAEKFRFTGRLELAATTKLSVSMAREPNAGYTTFPYNIILQNGTS